MLSGRTIRRWLIGTAVLAVVAVAAGNDWSGAPARRDSSRSSRW